MNTVESMTMELSGREEAGSGAGQKRAHASQSLLDSHSQPERSTSNSMLSRDDGTSKASHLSLRTPSSSSATSLSREFSFPYPQAYPIQLDLMRNIFECAEQGKVAVLESPTGTGKSLSLICATLTWLERNGQRGSLGVLEGPKARELASTSTASITSSSAADDAEPDWVRAHAQARARADEQRGQVELRQRIARARQAQQKEKNSSMAMERKSAAKWNKKKKRRTTTTTTSDAASEFESDSYLLSSGSGDETSRPIPSDDSAFLSSEVQALLAQLRAGASGSSSARKGGPTWGSAMKEEDEDEPATLPQVFYASRTHSQLMQFVAEVKKTKFGKDWMESEEKRDERQERVKEENTRCVCLASRKQMCINEEVIRTGETKGMEAMNEKCRDLAKGKGKKRCEYLPAQDAQGRSQILDYRDRAFSRVSDLEDLVVLGKEMGVCPYYASRAAARTAQLVALPYNLLLSQTSRETLGTSLDGAVVVLDEAHNVIDTVLEGGKVHVDEAMLRVAKEQIQTYLEKFASRLKGVNEVRLREFRTVIEALLKFAREWAGRAKSGKEGGKQEQMLKGAEVMKRIGGTLDQINLVALHAHLRQSQIARKVSGYADKQAMKARAGNAEGRTARSAISCMHAIQSFILALSNSNEDGRVFISIEEIQREAAFAVHSGTSDRPHGVGAASASAALRQRQRGSEQDEESVVHLRYQLLNPQEAFKPILEKARSVILAGGTMEPISDFTTQLFPQIDPQRFHRFSCGHIIPARNLLAAIVPSGPRGTTFEFKYESRGDINVLDDLASALSNYCNIVPHGLVVFLPSYAFLESATRRWKESGALNRLGNKKKIFFEPKNATDVDRLLEEYRAAIDAADQIPTGGVPARTGSMLLAVVGAKLSEGINFSDRLARAVIMVGMPFANAASVELKERMNYVRTLAKTSSLDLASTEKDAGQELYINLCMKAVNQSIGRAIRHQNDYAALILLDKRFARADIRARLPGWIRDSTRTFDRFGPSIAATGAFFRDKRGQ
ncbi:DNA repair helicase [Ceraceosorus guamensis]|uniref:ATP-dependent DNA helicase CHL1 n=1 Tax=Ceraceosorus guamensis TaxID=1522189 RepID=A0A316VV17_9BASI|nr:DNA repair helicase [Ceraceosorus guamensis]PWN40758.1 DNA repair helicase [Ceraceosorus guamensis]